MDVLSESLEPQQKVKSVAEFSVSFVLISANLFPRCGGSSDSGLQTVHFLLNHSCVLKWAFVGCPFDAQGSPDPQADAGVVGLGAGDHSDQHHGPELDRPQAAWPDPGPQGTDHLPDLSVARFPPLAPFATSSLSFWCCLNTCSKLLAWIATVLPA